MKLSPLAQKLFDKLNKFSHIMSIETAAWVLSVDQTISATRRLAYNEVYEYCRDNS